MIQIEMPLGVGGFEPFLTLTGGRLSKKLCKNCIYENLLPPHTCMYELILGTCKYELILGERSMDQWLLVLRCASYANAVPF